jgi:hypothetical protein
LPTTDIKESRVNNIKVDKTPKWLCLSGQTKKYEMSNIDLFLTKPRGELGADSAWNVDKKLATVYQDLNIEGKLINGASVDELALALSRICKHNNDVREGRIDAGNYLPQVNDK